MERLGVEYDVLPRESEILHLKFWEAAFEQLKRRGAIQLATEGKNAGCWVMRLGEAPAGEEGEEETETKIIVRSNGTVTYVGKDIAYQLWKFGLLGRDFHYMRFHTHPSGQVVWMSTTTGGDPDAPPFGGATSVYNVIDSRQSYLQKIVIEGLRALGFEEQASHSTHFAYEMVVLTPRCAAELGYEIPPEDAKRPFVGVSGRKGTGVKADDLLDRLEASARAEVDKRHPHSPEAECATLAHQIAVGALRYFLLKYTRSAKIPFDFEDALSFEGETGPYCQYAVVRARNIFRKWHEQEGTAPEQPMAFRMRTDYEPALLAAPGGDDLWEVVLLAGRLGSEVEAAVGAQEPAFIAKYAFQLSQAFNLFYHKHHILSETDADKKAFLLALTSVVERQLVAALGLLGIEAPEKM
jgi:arginyl-tRNA synthetase